MTFGVTALSPSDRRVEEEVAHLIDRAGLPIGLRDHNVNQVSVVLHSIGQDVATPGPVALLGGDLESGRRAWGHVAEAVDELRLPRATILKVPHHGSRSATFADHASTLLETDIVAVTTTFNRGVPAGRPPHLDVMRAMADAGRATHGVTGGPYSRGLGGPA